MKIISLLLSIGTFGYFATLVTKCRDLETQFHYSPLDLRLRLIESIHNEQGQSALITRAFNNKATGTVLDMLRHYLHYFDLQFLALFISPLGIFGIGYVLYLSFTKTNKWLFLILGVLLVIPFIELINVFGASNLKLFLLAPYFAVSLYGIWSFVSHKDSVKRSILIVILAVGSILWISVLQEDFGYYCEIRDQTELKGNDMIFLDNLQK